MSVFHTIVIALVLVEMTRMLSMFCPKGLRARRWWRLTPTQASIDLAQAIQALEGSTDTRRVRYLTIVRTKSPQSSTGRVWIGVYGVRDPQMQANAVAAATGCDLCEDDDVPFRLNESRWRMSRITSIKQGSPPDAKVTPPQASALAKTADSFLGDGDFILTTLRWSHNTKGVYARVVTTSDELARKWPTHANCKRQFAMFSSFAVPPLLVGLYCSALLVDAYLLPLPPVEWLMRRLDGEASLADIQLAWTCAVWAALRMVLEMCRPRPFRLVARYWHLPIGLRILFRGVPLSVSQIAGWAKAR